VLAVLPDPVALVPLPVVPLAPVLDVSVLLLETVPLPVVPLAPVFDVSVLLDPVPVVPLDPMPLLEPVDPVPLVVLVVVSVLPVALVLPLVCAATGSEHAAATANTRTFFLTHFMLMLLIGRVGFRLLACSAKDGPSWSAIAIPRACAKPRGRIAAYVRPELRGNRRAN
jgi:hypothetical protein